jgi:ferrochelatase
MRFAPEPPVAHASPQRTAILLCNLGTPDEPTAPAVRRYLAQFLSDPRVVEIPAWIWRPILHGIVLRTRPAASARKYASIWSDGDSPLRSWTVKQAKMLTGWLGERGHRVTVRAAMRYGQPAIGAVLDALKAEGATRILVLPLYPQYAASTTASAFDAVGAWAARTRALPELRCVNRYHDDPGFIGALAERVRAHWQTNGRSERLVLSFHGVPQRTVALGDPYHGECLETARLLRERLGLPEDELVVTFQSRFGKAKWLEPYTEPTLVELARQGVESVAVMCPGFSADCLETLEEIDQEVRAAYLAAGGREFHYIPCLNDSPAWITALADIAIRHLQGWPTGHSDPAALEARRQHAHSAGANA